MGKLLKMFLHNFPQTSPQAFSVGLDVKELIKPDTDRLRALRGAYLDCCSKLYGSFLPTASIVNGK